MKHLTILITILLFGTVAIAQPIPKYNPFAVGRGIDTANTPGSIKLDSAVRLTALSSSDSSLVYTDTKGYLHKISRFSLGLTKQSTFLDSIAAVRAAISAIPTLDTTSLSNRINLKLNIADTLNKWLHWSDTLSRLATKYYVDNAIASIPTPNINQVLTSGNVVTGGKQLLFENSSDDITTSVDTGVVVTPRISIRDSISLGNLNVVTTKRDNITGRKVQQAANANGTPAFAVDGQTASTSGAITLNAFVQNGNNFLAETYLGTTAQYGLWFKTNDTTRGGFDKYGRFIIYNNHKVGDPNGIIQYSWLGIAGNASLTMVTFGGTQQSPAPVLSGQSIFTINGYAGYDNSGVIDNSIPANIARLRMYTAGNQDTTHHAGNIGQLVKPVGSSTFTLVTMGYSNGSFAIKPPNNTTDNGSYGLPHTFTNYGSTVLKDTTYIGYTPQGATTDSTVVKKTDSTLGVIAPLTTILAGYAPITGSASYIQNSTAQQTSANYNIDGNGTIGGVLAADTILGGVSIAGNLQLQTTSNSAKGAVLIDTSFVFNSVNKSILIGRKTYTAAMPDPGVTGAITILKDTIFNFNLSSASANTNGVGFVISKATGTNDNPTATTSGQNLFFTSFRGHTGTNGFQTSGQLIIQASENWTNTARGQVIQLTCTKTGGTTRFQKFRTYGSGATTLNEAAEGQVAVWTTEDGTGRALRVGGRIGASDTIITSTIFREAGLLSSVLGTDASGNHKALADGTDFYSRTKLVDFSTTPITTTSGVSPTALKTTRYASAAGGNITITITFSYAGQEVEFQNTSGSNTITLAITGGNINDSATLAPATLQTQYGVVGVRYDGTNAIVY